MLKGKKILLAVTGSIAAYKAAILVRLLVKQEAEVKVIMTSSAKEFITPLTLSTLSKNPVLSTFKKSNGTGSWNNHVELAMWADLYLIAPASANTIAKMAHGVCDNLLLATYFSCKTTVFVAPAMDLDMYRHTTTQQNLRLLESHGDSIIEAEHGDLASGLTGVGRMSEPETILSILQDYFASKDRLKGKNVMVNAGPTHESIDPVRFIGNHSSGKMGYAIAERFAKLGASVHLISGPTQIPVSNGTIKLTKVTSAEEMYQACKQKFPKADIGVLAAAVADYKPQRQKDQKIKKTNKNLNLELVSTPDIALELGKSKKNGQILVGFALETEKEIENARKKIKSKNLDMIILNSLMDEGAGFGHNTNKISIIGKDNKIKEFKLKPKREVANDIVNEILERFNF